MLYLKKSIFCHWRDCVTIAYGVWVLLKSIFFSIFNFQDFKFWNPVDRRLHNKRYVAVSTRLYIVWAELLSPSAGSRRNREGSRGNGLHFLAQQDFLQTWDQWLSGFLFIIFVIFVVGYLQIPIYFNSVCYLILLVVIKYQKISTIEELLV